MKRSKPAHKPSMPKPPLANVKDQELKDELIRREASKRSLENVANLEKAETLLRHIDALLELVPDHTGYNCHDAYAVCGTDCTRCELLVIRDSGFNTNVVIDRLELRTVQTGEFRPDNLVVIVSNK